MNKTEILMMDSKEGLPFPAPEATTTPFKLMRRRYLKNILLIIGPLLLIMIALSVYQLVQQYKYQLREEKLNAQSMVNVMDTNWADVRNNMVQVAYRSNTISFVSMNRSVPDAAFRASFKEMQILLSQTISATSLGEYILLYCAEPEYFVSTNSGWSWYDQAYDHLSQHPMTLVRSLYATLETSRWAYDNGQLYYYQPIMIRRKSVGGVILRINRTKTDQALKTLLNAENSFFYVTDQDHRILFDAEGKNHNMPFEEVYDGLPNSGEIFVRDGAMYLFLQYPSSEHGWNYQLLIRMDVFQVAFQNSILLLSVVVFVVIAVCFVVSTRVASAMCRPLETIYTLLSQPTRDADADYSTQYAAYDDMGMIYTLIFKTQYLYFSMQNELTSQQQLLRDAQRKALQAQINPHFLFNTIESINWKVLEKLPGDKEIPSMIQALATILRMNLRINSPLTSIEDEVKHAQLYVELQKMRFPDQFTVQWDIEEGVLPLMTIRFSLQPILENAISHGVVLREQDGLICVLCHKTPAGIEFVITDNGPGFDRQTLEALQSSMVDSRVIHDTHIGLVNINARIQLVFGTDYRLELSNTPTGAQVRMLIPCLQPEDAEKFLQTDMGI